MTVLPRLFPAGTREMSHDISCTGQDLTGHQPNTLESVTVAVPYSSEGNFFCHSMGIQLYHTNIDRPTIDVGLAV